MGYDKRHYRVTVTAALENGLVPWRGLTACAAAAVRGGEADERVRCTHMFGDRKFWDSRPR
jgi:hypothetical protein